MSKENEIQKQVSILVRDINKICLSQPVSEVRAVAILTALSTVTCLAISVMERDHNILDFFLESETTPSGYWDECFATTMKRVRGKIENRIPRN